MGEPLSNYEAVVGAVQMMTDPRLFGLSRRHVTVSTVGVVPRIREMAKDLPVRARAGKSSTFATSLSGCLRAVGCFQVGKALKTAGVRKGLRPWQVGCTCEATAYVVAVPLK
jgi:hypothetical protein